MRWATEDEVEHHLNVEPIPGATWVTRYDYHFDPPLPFTDLLIIDESDSKQSLKKEL